MLIITPIIAAEETHNVIIKYKESTKLKSILSTKPSLDLKNIPKEKIRHHYNEKISATLTTSEINKLKENKNLKIIDIPQRKLFMQDTIYLTNSTNIWRKKENNINLTGKDETICIIDSGINYNHPDFGNCYGNNTNYSCKIIGGWDFCADNTNCSTQDWNPMDINGHGTHVAGIASANGQIKGIAPESKIVAVKVTNSTGAIWDDDIEAGIRFCINHAEEFNISTISMSLGGGEFQDYCDQTAYDPSNIVSAINDATAQNITVTIATGNDGSTKNISFPACIENATKIGSITKSSLISPFTNRGNNFIDLLLTYGGTNSGGYTYINPNTIDSNYIGSTYLNNQYAFMSGTSMSTPMAAGIITLLKQYKKLESNKPLTNEEVKEILINSSQTYYDAASNGNYSIINSLATILYSDESLPQTTLISPENSLLTLIRNQTFSCNATDNSQLKNLTLEIYNSTNLIYSLTNSSPINNTLTINQSINLTNADIYNWNCLSYDNHSNYNQTENRTILTYYIQTQIITPLNNTYTNQNETTFNCSAQSTEELTNTTFFLYKNNSLIYNETKNITGLSNYSIFNYTLPNETIYYYNCKATNNQSQSIQTKNHTITYDKTSPQITLNSPTNNTKTQTKTQTFTYTENETNPNYCNLTLNNEIKSSFTQTLSDGTYNWNVTCKDLANNTNTSETFKLEIYTKNRPTGGGGSSPSTTTPKEYEITKNLTQGKQQKLEEKDSIKFKIKSEDHKITLNKIEKNKVKITLESTPRNITLYLYSPTKINLDNDETFDLELILLKIENGAEIFIKEINENIPQKRIFNKTQSETTKPTQEKKSFKQKSVEAINFIIDSLNTNQFKKIFELILNKPISLNYKVLPYQLF